MNSYTYCDYLFSVYTLQMFGIKDSFRDMLQALVGSRDRGLSCSSIVRATQAAAVRRRAVLGSGPVEAGNRVLSGMWATCPLIPMLTSLSVMSTSLQPPLDCLAHQAPLCLWDSQARMLGGSRSLLQGLLTQDESPESLRCRKLLPV